MKKILMFFLLAISFFAVGQNIHFRVWNPCPPDCSSDNEQIYPSDKNGSETNFVRPNSENNAVLLVYPNPAGDYLDFRLENVELENSQIQIINSMGEVILQTSFLSNINVSHLTAGYYLIQISANSHKVYRAKFIKS